MLYLVTNSCPSKLNIESNLLVIFQTRLQVDQLVLYDVLEWMKALAKNTGLLNLDSYKFVSCGRELKLLVKNVQN